MLQPVRLRNGALRVVLAFGLLLIAVRVAGGLLLMLVERLLGEADLLLLFDIPTIGMYLLIGQLFGSKHNIQNVYDARFFIIGALTWFFLGCGVGLLIAFFRRRRLSDDSTPVRTR